jgi:asparaginyl-tRNA synthetase
VLQNVSDYPITPKDHGVEFLMDNRHLWLRSSQQWAIMRIRTTIKRAIIDFLDNEGFLNIDTPIITPAAAEGTSTLFELGYFDEKAYLAQTGQLYNEANIMAFGKVYCFGPTFRAEKSKTRRHLAEFWMVEPEMAYFDLDDLMGFEERFIEYIVQTTLAKRRPELALLERDLTALENIKAPFPRISYDEAIERIAAIREATDDPELKEQLAIEWGDDFGSPHETVLTKQFDRPVFVYGYPTQVKAFYMEPWPGRPEVCKSVDLLAPEGYGEIIGGSERMSNPDVLVAAIEKHQLPRGALPVVHRFAPLWQRAAQRLWPGSGAHRGLDLRHRPHSPDQPVPAHPEPNESIKMRRKHPQMRLFFRSHLRMLTPPALKFCVSCP